MNPKNRIRIVRGIVFPLVVFIVQLSLPLAGNGWATASMLPESEDTFEFECIEREGAHDLHIEWSRAVTIKDATPFKNKEGSGTSRTDLSNGQVRPFKKATVTVTWDGSRPEVKRWWWTKKNGARLGNVKIGNPPKRGAQVTPRQTGNGLQTGTFNVAPGRITVTLPDDMRAGDTISGTVSVEPNGQTKEEQDKNMGILSGYVIALDEPFKVPAPDLVITTIWPVDTPARNIPVTFKATVTNTFNLFLMPNETSPVGACTRRSGPLTAINEGCSPISQLVFKQPTYEPITVNETPPPIFTVPVLGQTGKPIVITGPFDGNSSNTGVTCQPAGPTEPPPAYTPGQSIYVLAESPHRAIFTSPTNLTGPLQVTVNESGKKTTMPFRNVGVNLSAPKTSLLKGETTTLTVRVEGLAGIKENVPLSLEKDGVVTMQGGDFQIIRIKPTEVQADGSFTMTRTLTGQQAGTFSITAIVACVTKNVLDGFEKLLDGSKDLEYIEYLDYWISGLAKLLEAEGRDHGTDTDDYKYLKRWFDGFVHTRKIMKEKSKK